MTEENESHDNSGTLKANIAKKALEIIELDRIHRELVDEADIAQAKLDALTEEMIELVSGYFKDGFFALRMVLTRGNKQEILEIGTRYGSVVVIPVEHSIYLQGDKND